MVASISILSQLRVAGAIILDSNQTEFPPNPQLGTFVMKDLALYVYCTILGTTTWYPIIRAPESYAHSQGEARLEWTVNHNLNSTDVWYQIQDADGNMMTPAGFTSLGVNSFRLTFSEPVLGRVLVLSGGVEPTEGGASGDSAYQVAVNNGFVGTEAEWLASLESNKLAEAMQSLYANFADELAPYVGKNRWRPRATAILKKMFAELGTAPTTNLVVDVLKNGVSIFAGAKFTVPAGQATSSLVLPSPVTVTPDDYLTLSIVSGNGSDMTLRIDYQTDLVAA